ncbi:MAG TPA: zf-HC2 domain-containing protein, partial [Candidatus Krumholzibacteria bacterium]|nr:zf-HC2 domain-containing protein [Candidatus Krumholzibacteria bacterium]
MHLSEENIQRFLHGELDARSREALSAHVAGCDRCARQLAEAEREEHEIFDLLGRLDHEPPRVDATSIARGRGALAVWGRRAAVFVAAAALAGAAYAIPGSPLPAVFEKVAQWIAREPSTPQSGESVDSLRVASGIAVPARERFALEFVAEQTRGAVALSLTDGSNVAVRAFGDTVTFTTDAGRLT